MVKLWILHQLCCNYNQGWIFSLISIALFPTKLNGLSLIYFIKDLGKINLSLDDEVEMIISGEYEKRQKEIEEGQKVMFEYAVDQLKSTIPN